MATNWGKTSFQHPDYKVQQEFERIALTGNTLTKELGTAEERISKLERANKGEPTELTKRSLITRQDKSVVESDTTNIDFLKDSTVTDSRYDAIVSLLAEKYVANWVEISGITNMEKIAKKIYYEMCQKIGSFALRHRPASPISLFIKLDNLFIPNHPKQTSGTAPYWNTVLYGDIAVNKGFDVEFIGGKYKNIIAPKDGLYKLNYRWSWINGFLSGRRIYQYKEADVYLKTHLIVNDIVASPECELDIVKHNEHSWQHPLEYVVGSVFDLVADPTLADYSWQSKGIAFVWLKAGDKVRVAIEYDRSTEAQLTGSVFATGSYLLQRDRGEASDQDNGYLELHYIGNKSMKGKTYYV